MADTTNTTGKGFSNLTFNTPARDYSGVKPKPARKQLPPMPVVTDADLAAPQRLQSLPGYWWEPADWKLNGVGIFTPTFDPLASSAAYLLEIAFGFAYGTPSRGTPAECVEDFAREYGQRAAKSLRWRYKVPVAEQALISVYRSFLARHILNTTPDRQAADATVLDMQAHRRKVAEQRRAASEAERRRIAAVLTVDEKTGQIGMAL